MDKLEYEYNIINSEIIVMLVIGVNRKMSPDELVYLGILGASIPVGFLFRYLSKSDKVFLYVRAHILKRVNNRVIIG